MILRSLDQLHAKVDALDERLRAVEQSRVRTSDLDVIRGDVKAAHGRLGALEEQQATARGKLVVLTTLVGVVSAALGFMAKVFGGKL